MLAGPPNQTLRGPEYVAWLDSGGYMGELQVGAEEVEALPNRVCELCHKPFVSKRQDARLCSAKCRQRSKRWSA